MHSLSELVQKVRGFGFGYFKGVEGFCLLPFSFFYHSYGLDQKPFLLFSAFKKKRNFCSVCPCETCSCMYYKCSSIIDCDILSRIIEDNQNVFVDLYLLFQSTDIYIARNWTLTSQTFT